MFIGSLNIYPRQDPTFGTISRPKRSNNNIAHAKAAFSVKLNLR